MTTTTQPLIVRGFVRIVDGRACGYSEQRQSPEDLPLMTVNEHYQRMGAQARQLNELREQNTLVQPSAEPALRASIDVAANRLEVPVTDWVQPTAPPDATEAARALVEVEAKKYSLNAAGLFDSGAPDHGQTIAIQELLAGFDEDEAEDHWEAIMAYSDLRASDALSRAAALLAAASAQGGE